MATRTERIRWICMKIGEEKRQLHNISVDGANGNYYALRFANEHLKAIDGWKKYLKEVESEEENILDRFDCYTHWGRGSEDGDWVFAFIRDDKRHANHIAKKLRRAKSREYKKGVRK